MVLKDMTTKGPSGIDVAVATQQLEECFSMLRRETAFKPVPPGEPAPLLSYELVEAKDFVESAMGALAASDVTTALEHCRTALSHVQRGLRR